MCIPDSSNCSECRASQADRATYHRAAQRVALVPGLTSVAVPSLHWCLIMAQPQVLSFLARAGVFSHVQVLHDARGPFWKVKCCTWSLSLPFLSPTGTLLCWQRSHPTWSPTLPVSSCPVCPATLTDGGSKGLPSMRDELAEL